MLIEHKANIRGELYQKSYKKEIIKYLILMPIFLAVSISLFFLASKEMDDICLATILGVFMVSIATFGFFRMVKQINNTIRSIVIDYDSKIALFKTYPTIITKEKDAQCSFDKLEFLSSEFGVFRKNLFSGWEIVCGKNRLRYVFDFYDDIQKEEIFNLRNLD